MAEIKITFGKSVLALIKAKRIQKEYGMTPQHFAEEAIYYFQTEAWSFIKSMTVDTPLQERPICYIPKKQ